jgi:predicted cation transporter
MKNPLINYFLARLGLFILVFCLLLLTGLESILSALFAAMISLAISLIFLQKQRDKVSTMIYNRVNRAKATGNAEPEGDVENEKLDQADTGNTPEHK